MKDDKHVMIEQTLPFDIFSAETPTVETTAAPESAESVCDEDIPLPVAEQELPLLFDEMPETDAVPAVGTNTHADTENGEPQTAHQPRPKFKGRPMARKREPQPKAGPSYLSKLNPAKAEELAGRIFQMVVVEKGFLDKNISARELVKRLGTNTRYFSITMNRRFHCNFSTFLNKLRVEEAMTRMADARFDEVPLQDLAGMVGFASRQSFINAFQKVQGMTPSEYRATVR